MGTVRTFLILLAVSPFVSAVDPPKIDAEQLAKDLGNPAFAIRDKASRELWKLGVAARPALEKAANSDDPEVAKRAAEILEKFDWGIFPDTPASILSRIKDFRSNELERQQNAISALLATETRGVETLGLLLAHDLEAERRDQLFRHLQVHTRDLVPLLLFDRKEARAEAILELGTLGPFPEAWLDYCAFQSQRGRKETAIAFLEQASKRPGDASRFATMALAVAEHLAGRSESAIRRVKGLPKETLPPSFLASLLEDARAWTELASDVDDAEGPRNPGLLYYRYRKSGQVAKVAELLTELKRTGAEGDRDSAAEAGLALLLNQRTLEGIEVLKEKNAHPRLLADVYAGRLMFKEVLDMLGDGPLAKELEDRDERRSRAYYEMRKARVFAQIGRKDDAVQLFNRIFEHRDQNDSYLARELLRAELRSGFHDLAVEHGGTALELLEKNESSYATPEPMELLFDDEAEAARGIWQALRDTQPFRAEPAGTRMRRIRELLIGKASPQRIADALTAIEGRFARDATEGSIADRVRNSRALAAIARRSGKWVDVETNLRKSVAIWSIDGDEKPRSPEDVRQLTNASSSGPRSWLFNTNETVKIALDLGEYYVERNRPVEAAKVFEQAWRQYPNNPIPLYLSGRALLAAHDETEGKRRIAIAHRVALGDAQQTGRLLFELCERGQMADVRRALESARLAAWYWTPWRGNVWNQMARASYLLKEFETSAVAIERNLHFLLKTPNVVFVDGTGYVTVPTSVRSSRALAAHAAGKVDEAFAESKAILQLIPGQLEFLNAIVPEFDKAGKKTEADALFAITWSTFQRLQKENPESSWVRASAAFAAAGCRRELDAALALAKSAFDRDPEIRWHREVLAEVHFRRGERADAVKHGEALVKQDHRSHYFKRLLERYQTADIGSPLPLAPEED